MIIPQYTIQPSTISNAGQGLYLAQAVKRGNIIVAPTEIKEVLLTTMVEQFDVNSIEHHSSVRWFENYCTISPDWPDECYINHSFNPTGLWHLGFIFALHDLSPGTEVTVDYRFLLLENETSNFLDAQTGQAVVGLPWRESLKQSAALLYQLIN